MYVQDSSTVCMYKPQHQRYLDSWVGTNDVDGWYLSIGTLVYNLYLYKLKGISGSESGKYLCFARVPLVALVYPKKKNVLGWEKPFLIFVIWEDNLSPQNCRILYMPVSYCMDKNFKLDAYAYACCSTILCMPGHRFKCRPAAYEAPRRHS